MFTTLAMGGLKAAMKFLKRALRKGRKWIFSAILLSALLSCSQKENNNQNPSAECKGEGDCWKKVCPQKEKFEFEECVKNRISTAIPPTKDKPHIPEYVTCNAGKCEDIPTDNLASGEVSVIPTESGTRIKWLRLYIFPDRDWDGNPLNCKRLKEEAEKDPKSLMSQTMARYFPPRDYNSPITTPVQTQGDSYPLLFTDNPPTVPAGKNRIILVQGFCDPPQGRPEADTPHKWWACKECVEIKPGNKNQINIKLPVKISESCN